MKRTILAALLVGAATSFAAAADTAATDIESGKATIVYDGSLADEFKIKREIVDRAQEAFGESAAYETPQDLPDSSTPSLCRAIRFRMASRRATFPPSSVTCRPWPTTLTGSPRGTTSSRWTVTTPSSWSSTTRCRDAQHDRVSQGGPVSGGAVCLRRVAISPGVVASPRPGAVQLGQCRRGNGLGARR